MKKKTIVLLTVIAVIVGIILFSYFTGGNGLYFGDPSNVLEQIDQIKEEHNLSK